MKVNTDKAVRGFYAIVLGTALAGSVTAAAKWLEVDWRLAIPPIVAVELGGVVLMMYAADRQKLGERATVARLLSAGVAGMAVATNYFGHATKPGQAYFFAGLSLLGYIVYLLMAGAKRRDALRAAGKLEATAPLYGLWQWMRHPGITRRARHLALANAADRLFDPTVPVLGRGASLAAAVRQVRAEKREGAISTALDTLIRDAAGPVMADIAVHTYDLDQVARRIADTADYDGLTALLAADLTPAKLASAGHADSDMKHDIMAVADAVAPTPADDILDRMRSLADGVEQRISDAVSDTVSQARQSRRTTRARHDSVTRPRRMGRPGATPVHVTVSLPERPKRDTTSDTVSQRKAPSARQGTAARVAAAVAKNPTITADALAKRLDVSVRTVQRNWPKTNGAEVTS